MSKGRILVSGASGFLGWNLLSDRWPDWEWTACANRHDPGIPGLDLRKTDLTQPGSIRALLDATQPDIVIHTAALTDLNACEADPGRTARVNAEVPGHLARHCAARGIRLVFTSSDMVFDGANPPYYEETPPCPLNAYGQQKAQAEGLVLAACPDAAVCRMPLMFGAAGPAAHNFLPEWIARLSRGDTVSLFTDEYRAPVSARLACDGLRLVIERAETGIIHLGGRERMSRFDFGRLLCTTWGFDITLLSPVKRADLAFKAPRPSDTFFDSSRAWAWGYASASLEEQLRTVKAEGRVA